MLFTSRVIWAQIYELNLPYHFADDIIKFLIHFKAFMNIVYRKIKIISLWVITVMLAIALPLRFGIWGFQKHFNMDLLIFFKEAGDDFNSNDHPWMSTCAEAPCSPCYTHTHTQPPPEQIFDVWNINFDSQNYYYSENIAIIFDNFAKNVCPVLENFGFSSVTALVINRLELCVKIWVKVGKGGTGPQWREEVPFSLSPASCVICSIFVI